jgi:hypothetical protein
VVPFRTPQTELHAGFEWDMQVIRWADEFGLSEVHADTDRGHSRTEHRTLRVADCGDALFPAARQVFRLRRDTGGLDGVRTSKEIVYAITSLTAGLAPPAHLNHYTRRHWTVENRLHYVRDVTFREDLSQLRTGTAPRVIATFRNLSVSAFAGRANIAHARRDRHDPGRHPRPLQYLANHH